MGVSDRSVFILVASSFLAEYSESMGDIVFFLTEVMYGVAFKPESLSIADSGFNEFLIGSCHGTNSFLLLSLKLTDCLFICL